MICYRDRTFCPFWKDCADGKDCTRALTDEIIAAARVWWKSFSSKDEAPICQFAEKPECWRAGVGNPQYNARYIP
jgi:hypothetical protein